MDGSSAPRPLHIHLTDCVQSHAQSIPTMNSYLLTQSTLRLKAFLMLVSATGLAILSQGADYEKSLQDLIPQLADPNVSARYDAQMRLQDLASQCSRPGQPAEREALGKLLALKATDASVPQPARVWMVRQIEYMGHAEVLPALTQLLNGNDAELRECARRALEKNPAPEASIPLRQSLESASDAAWKIGLIHSLGERRDAASAALISRELADTAAGNAAAWALGKIANPAAVKALWPFANRLHAAGEALIEAATRRLNQGETSAAKAIAKELYGQTQTPSLRAAAVIILAQTDARGVWPMIKEMLGSHDPRCQQAAITAARVTRTKDWDMRLANWLPELDASAKAQVLGCVGRPAEPAVVKTAADGDANVRLAALEALGRMGSAAGVPPLLDAATQEDRGVRQLAETALTKINGPNAAQAVEKAARSGNARIRAAAINALALRQQANTAPALLQYAGEPDPIIRTAAIAALGKVGTEAELEPVVRLALASQNAETFAAVRSIATRSQNKALSSRKIAELVGNDEASSVKLLDAFATLGDPESLARVAKLAEGAHAEAAIRALGNWSTFAAADPLLKIVSDARTPAPKYQAALQGLTQLIEASDDESAENRAKALIAAFNAARSIEDKKQVIPIFGAVPHSSLIEVIKPLLKDGQLRTEAGAAGIALARALNASNKPAATELAQAIRDANLSPEINRRANAILR